MQDLPSTGWGTYCRRLLTRFLLVMYGLSAAGQAVSDGPLRLYYLANRQGEVEPCGCSVDQQGGLHRLANAFAEGGGRSPRVVVDSGDTFFSLRRLPEHRREQERLQAGLIAAAYAEMKVDVFSPGERDFAGGLAALFELIKTSAAVPVSVNLYRAGGTRLFAPYHLIERGGLRTLVLGVSYFDPAGDAGKLGLEIRPWETELKSLWKEVAALGADFIVVASQLGLATDRELAQKFPVTAVLGARTLEALSEAEKSNGALLVQPQIRGQWAGLMLLEKAKSPEHRVIELTKAYEKPENKILLMMLEQKKKQRDIALKQSEKALKKVSKEPYVGHAESCRMCHAKQTEFWENTKHSSAYLALYAKNQHFDPECIQCHSLGFGEAQGFQKIAQPIEWAHKKTQKKGDLPWVEQLLAKSFVGDKGGPLDSREEPERFQKVKKQYHAAVAEWEATGKIKRLLIGVQCEHCHGNRHGHPGAKSMGVKKVSETSCKACHTPPHAKAYDPEMFAKVACPLSGH